MRNRGYIFGRHISSLGGVDAPPFLLDRKTTSAVLDVLGFKQQLFAVEKIPAFRTCQDAQRHRLSESLRVQFENLPLRFGHFPRQLTRKDLGILRNRVE